MQTHEAVLLVILIVFVVIATITALCMRCFRPAASAQADEDKKTLCSFDSATGFCEYLLDKSPDELAATGVAWTLFELLCCSVNERRPAGVISLIRAWIVDESDPRFWLRLILMELVECGGTIQTLFRAERLGVPPVRSIWPIWGYVALTFDAISIAPLFVVLIQGIANKSSSREQVTGFVGKTTLIVIEILADSFHFATAKGYIDAVWSRTGEYKISGAFFLWWAFINMLLSSISLAGTLQSRIAPMPPHSFAVRRFFYACILAGYLLILWQLTEFTLTKFRTGQCELVDCYAYNDDCNDSPPNLRDSRSSAPRLRDSGVSTDDDYLHPRYDRVFKCEKTVDVGTSVFCRTAWTCVDKCYEYRSRYDPPDDNYFVGVDTQSNCEVYFSRRMDDYSAVYPIFLNGTLAIFLIFWLCQLLRALGSCACKCDFNPNADDRLTIVDKEIESLDGLGKYGDCCPCCGNNDQSTSGNVPRPSCCTCGNCLKCLCCLCVDSITLQVKRISLTRSNDSSTSNTRDYSESQPQSEQQPKQQPQPQSQPKTQADTQSEPQAETKSQPEP